MQTKMLCPEREEAGLESGGERSLKVAREARQQTELLQGCWQNVDSWRPIVLLQTGAALKVKAKSILRELQVI